MDRSAVATDGAASDPSRPVNIQQPPMEEELNLGRYLTILRRHWLTLVLGSMVGGVAGFVGASLRPVLYEGVTTILIGRSSSVIATATSRALLENRTLAAEMLAEIGSSVSPEAFVTNLLTVEQVPSTNVMKVRVKSEDAATAAQASRVLSQKAVELNRRVASEEGSAVRGQLKGLLDQAADRLKTAEGEYLRYEDQAQIELLKRDTERMIAERGELLKLRIDIETERARLAAAEQEIKKQERVYSLPRAVNAETALQRTAERTAAADVTNEALRRVEDQSSALKNSRTKARPAAPPPAEPSKDPAKRETARQEPQPRQRPDEDLERRFDAQAAAVIGTQEALTRITRSSGEVDPQFLDLSHPFVNPVYQTLAFQIATSRTRLAALERQEREMAVVRKLGNTRFGELSDLYRRTAELSRLETNLDLAKQVYQTLTVRYEQSRAESVDSMVQLQIVDAAVTPERPLSRKRAQAGVLGLTVGLMVAAIAALARGILQERTA
jgi:capsular polysaccharide biosynthesis protein